MTTTISRRMAAGIIFLGLTAAGALAGCGDSGSTGGAQGGHGAAGASATPAAQTGSLEALQGDGIGSSGSLETSIPLSRATIDVSHVEPSSLGGIVGGGGSFKGTIVIDAKATGHVDSNNAHLLDIELMDAVTCINVQEQKPGGLALVGWEETIMPLPNYAYQTITNVTAVFDSGKVSQDVSSGTVEFAIPPGAGRLVEVDVHVLWNETDVTVALTPAA